MPKNEATDTRLLQSYIPFDKRPKSVYIRVMNSKKLYYTPMGYEKASSMHLTARYDSVTSEAEARAMFEADGFILEVDIHTRPLKKGKKSWQCQGTLLSRDEEA